MGPHCLELQSHKRHAGSYLGTSNSQQDSRTAGHQNKYKSCVPQIQIGFCKEILVEKRFTNSVRQEAS